MEISVSGNAIFDNSLYTVSEAGEDFAENIVSESNVEISVVQSSDSDKNNNNNQKWSINVYKTDIDWDSNISLQIKRSGDGKKTKGNGNTNIHDGENYRDVTDVSTYFFQGKAEIINIPIDIQLSGISLIMGARDFETNIVFTVYDSW